MKILCVSDHIDPLVYSNNIRERFAEVDLVLAAGDLPLDYLDFIISSLNKPLLFVFGNHHLDELKYYDKSWLYPLPIDDENKYQGPGALYVHGKLVREEGLIVAGLGGCMKYNKAANQFSDREMFFQILRLIPGMVINRIIRGRYLDILLTHASPLGIHDKKDLCHRGFKCFLWFMKTFKPRYLIHGHIHLYDLSDVRTTQCGDTLVINAYSHYVLDTEEKNE